MAPAFAKRIDITQPVFDAFAGVRCLTVSVYQTSKKTTLVGDAALFTTAVLDLTHVVEFAD